MTDIAVTYKPMGKREVNLGTAKSEEEADRMYHHYKKTGKKLKSKKKQSKKKVGIW